MRMEILNDYVDYFVIVEATRTFKGQLRESLSFDIEKYSEFKHKIRYYIFDGPYDFEDSWKNEINQKRA
jgi:beta-1,4-mannosyl-glycoprotein beta-1,4-N-acetylglucosaminyltransferase